MKKTKIFPKQIFPALDKSSRGKIFLSDFFVLQFFQRLARNNFFIKFSFYDLNQPYWPGKSFLQAHIYLTSGQQEKTK